MSCHLLWDCCKCGQMRTLRVRRAWHDLSSLNAIKLGFVGKHRSYSDLASPAKQTQAYLRVLRKEEHGLRDNLISTASWRVLNRLHDAGYTSYLVGGSVRDMLVKQTPKDFDILTTAEPKQVKETFVGRCIIVGRRFPVCHVNSLNSIIEVSSFSTNSDKGNKVVSNSVKGTEGWDDHDYARWQNGLKRDFTINGLMYDPFQCIVYDYVGGLRDLRKSKIRTVIPAQDSFEEDPARMLRAIRIAARLEFSFATSTANAIKQQKSSLLALNKTRLQLEVNTMMAYGASERSMRLLWRFGVLEYLLPLQARYLVSVNFKRQSQGTNQLLELLANLDRVTAADRPCHGGLWVAVLAFHLALIEQPRGPAVVSAVALALSLGTGLRRALLHLKKSCGNEDRKATTNWNELLPDVHAMDEATTLEECQSLVDASIDNVANLFIAPVTSKTLQDWTGSSPPSDLDNDRTAPIQNLSVVISRPYFYKAKKLFNRALVCDSNKSPAIDTVNRDTPLRVNDPVQIKLMRGDIVELGHVFSHIVLSTLFPAGSSSQ